MIVIATFVTALAMAVGGADPGSVPVAIGHGGAKIVKAHPNGRVVFYVPPHTVAVDRSTRVYLIYMRVNGRPARMVDSQTADPHEVFGIAGIAFDGVSLVNRSDRRLRVTAAIVNGR